MHSCLSVGFAFLYLANSVHCMDTNKTALGKMQVCRRIFDACPENEDQLLDLILNDEQLFHAITTSRDIFAPYGIPERLVFEGFIMGRGSAAATLDTQQARTILDIVDLDSLRNAMAAAVINNRCAEDLVMAGARKLIAQPYACDFKQKLDGLQWLGGTSAQGRMTRSQVTGVLPPHLHLANRYQQIMACAGDYSRIEPNPGPLLMSAYDFPCETLTIIDESMEFVRNARQVESSWEMPEFDRAPFDFPEEYREWLDHFRLCYKLKREKLRLFDATLYRLNKVRERVVSKAASMAALVVEPNILVTTATIDEIDQSSSLSLIADLIEDDFRLITTNNLPDLKAFRLVCKSWSGSCQYRALHPDECSFRRAVLEDKHSAAIFFIRLMMNYGCNNGLSDDVPWHLYASSESDCLGLIIEILAKYAEGGLEVDGVILRDMLDMRTFQRENEPFFEAAVRGYVDNDKSGFKIETLARAINHLKDYLCRCRALIETAVENLTGHHEEIANLTRALVALNPELLYCGPDTLIRMIECTLPHYPDIVTEIMTALRQYKIGITLHVMEQHLYAEHLLKGPSFTDCIMQWMMEMFFPNGLVSEREFMGKIHLRGHDSVRRVSLADCTLDRLGEYNFAKFLKSGRVSEYYAEMVALLRYVMRNRHDPVVRQHAGAIFTEIGDHLNDFVLSIPFQ